MAAHVYQGLMVTPHVCWDQRWSHIYAGYQCWPFMYAEDQGWPHMSKVATHECSGSTVDTCMSGINGGHA